MKTYKIIIKYIIITGAALSILFLTFPVKEGNKTVILLTENRGILVSKNEGDNWKELNTGLPEKFIPLKLKTDSKHNLYLITLSSGIYKKTNGSVKWKSINSTGFLSRGKTAKPGEYRKISAFAINPGNHNNIALATKHSLYISYNGGDNWKQISLNGLNSRNYITSLCLKGNDPVIYAGTSFKGIFKYNNKKNKFYKFSKGIPKEHWSKKVYFYEEISEIYSPANELKIYTGLAFGRGIFFSNGKTAWKTLKAPINSNTLNTVYNIYTTPSSIYVTTDKGLLISNRSNGKWKMEKPDNYTKTFPENTFPLTLLIFDNIGESQLIYHLNNYSLPQKKISLKPDNRKGIYSSVYSVKRKLNSLIQDIKKSGLNSIVIDMKDDFGYLHFPTKNQTAIETGAVKKPVKITNILKTLKENGIYAIARLVVFKDRTLFKAYKNRYAIINKRTNRPWKGNPNEYWVDPHSDFVQNYNIKIAKELENLGFDEIQFDYIRFPTDGPTHLFKFRYKDKSDIYKSEVLSDFLKKAKRQIGIPVSVDIYGFNAWYNSGNWMGQDIEEFSRIVDVISPMDYPSHFGNRFYMKGPRSMRSFRIIYQAGRRANRLVNMRVYIRPYLQAFNLKSPTWGTGYIKNQVIGAEKSFCSGYIFWNARTDYRTVTKALSK